MKKGMKLDEDLMSKNVLKETTEEVIDRGVKIEVIVTGDPGKIVLYLFVK